MSALSIRRCQPRVKKLSTEEKVVNGLRNYRIDGRRILITLCVAAAAVVALAVSSQLRGQSAEQAQSSSGTPAFDAVSIKSSKSGDNRMGIRPEPGGRFVGTNVTVETLITMAYSTLLHPIKLIGGPSWINSEHFDIEAKAAGNASMDEMRPMLQTMLADRFKLTAHHETRQSQQYSLVLVREGKLGPKLVPHGRMRSAPTFPPLLPRLHSLARRHRLLAASLRSA